MSDSDLFDESDCEDVLVPATISEKKIVHKKTVECSKLIDEPKFIKRLQQSFSALAERKRPYVFYTLQQILSFTQNSAPVSNKIRTIGIYGEKNTKLQYLTNRSEKVLLDFKLAKKQPLMAEQIQIFGFIDFKHLERSVPVLVVQFWNAIEGDVVEFITKLQQLQHFLHVTGCRSVNDIDSTYLENTTVIESYFEEINDTVFNKAADEAENVCKTIHERLNASEDLFE